MQVRFVEEYVSDPSSPTKAAKRAGYALESATQQASGLMADPRIRRAIQIAQDKRAESIGISKERILQELAKIAFAEVGAEIKVTEDGDIDMNSLRNIPAEVTINATSGKNKAKMTSVKTVKMADKIAALVKMGQHLGMFKDQVEITGKVSLADLITQSYEAEIVQEEVPLLEDKSQT